MEPNSQNTGADINHLERVQHLTVQSLRNVRNMPCEEKPRQLINSLIEAQVNLSLAIKGFKCEPVIGEI